jgi:hypothetical protein
MSPLGVVALFASLGRLAAGTGLILPSHAQQAGQNAPRESLP